MNDQDMSQSVTTLQRRVSELETALTEALARIAQYEALANEDALTGILNRRGFLREANRALAFNQRYGTPVGLVLLDLDGLKRVNDQWGHEAGDSFIAGAAKILIGSVRSSDSVARIGGDEFAILLWYADLERTEVKARSVQALIDGQKSRVGTEDIRFGASIGWADLTIEKGLDQTMAEADELLYANKAARKSLRVT